jgi:hypothetical protein
MTQRGSAPFGFRISSFFRHWEFAIRHLADFLLANVRSNR